MLAADFNIQELKLGLDSFSSRCWLHTAMAYISEISDYSNGGDERELKQNKFIAPLKLRFRFISRSPHDMHRWIAAELGYGF